ncbi:TPA: ArsR family transcriptional regulator [Vibrio diabolicus]
MKVNNPLTIIAIFAGLAETLATVALIQLPLEVQQTFVYFVMIFPVMIVLLFFLVLYFKNTALYAPSDFDNQNHYLEVNRLKERLDEKIDVIFKDMNTNGIHVTQQEIEQAKGSLSKLITRETLPIAMLEILDHISDNPMTVAELSNITGLLPVAIMTYLSKLKSLGFVENIENGAWVART